MIMGRASDTYRRRLTIIFLHIRRRLILGSLSAAGSSEGLGSACMLGYDLGSLRGIGLPDSGDKNGRKMIDRRYSALRHGSSWEAVQAKDLSHV